MDAPDDTASPMKSDSAANHPCGNTPGLSTIRTNSRTCQCTREYTTSCTRSPNCFANAKSRSSCAGTAMIAPDPYPIST